MTMQRTTGDTANSTVRHDPAQDYWQTLARTADLARKLTALADRYDLAGDGDARAEERRASVALMRTVADSAHRLISSVTPPPPAAAPHGPTSSERADGAQARDVRAAGRDAAADQRDERAVRRDRAVRRAGADGDADFAGRFLAACDRDDAVGDRAAALADRRAAAADRTVDAARVVVDLDKHARSYALVTLPEEQEIVRQAQGVLMARAGITAGEAFEALLLAAAGQLEADGVVGVEPRSPEQDVRATTPLPD